MCLPENMPTLPSNNIGESIRIALHRADYPVSSAPLPAQCVMQGWATVASNLEKQSSRLCAKNNLCTKKNPAKGGKQFTT